MEKEKRIFVRLRENGREGRLPMHMPGHKRNGHAAPHLTELSLREDITEIEGFDNLHGAEGILARSMERAAALWGAARSFFLVNGATGGLLAAIRAATRRGDTVIMTRAAHASVYHAVELCGLCPVFLQPPVLPEWGIAGSVSPESIQAALLAHPEARLLILTSPTYEGVVTDIKAAAEMAHKAGIPLLVDEAHGAHLSLAASFPAGAVQMGADLVVQSVHKTLSSLTQTAILHLSGDLVDADRLSHELSVFQTSSPSYLLLSSIDGCVGQLAEEPLTLAPWVEALAAFRAAVSGLSRLSVLFHDGMPLPDTVFRYDPSKIYVCTAKADLTGPDLAALLRKEGIEPEMVAPEGVLLMSGAGDTEESLLFLARALHRIDARLGTADKRPLPTLPAVPSKLSVLPEEALSASHIEVPLAKAQGRISAGYVWAYPPGIPLLIPGEEITGETIAFLQATADRVTLRSTWPGIPSRITVVL